MQGFHQPAINVDSLHVEDSLLTYVCILLFFFHKNIPSAVSQSSARMHFHMIPMQR